MVVLAVGRFTDTLTDMSGSFYARALILRSGVQQQGQPDDVVGGHRQIEGICPA
jgi:hypothetical protein